MTRESSDPDTSNLQVEDFRSWPSSKFADPKSVEHGIRLAKPISQTARSWWAQRWLSIIHQFGLGVRLERAKLYAMRGQVMSIQIENGVVKSQVQGADNEPYRVIIAVKTIPKAIWTAILSDFALSSSFGIMLASGSLPSEEEIDRTFRENGVLLFPDRQGEMQTKCSCLDWSNPCKHIAAVYLLLAAEFEKDPLLIFKLRGLAPGDLFALLKTPSDQNSEAADGAVSPAVVSDDSSSAATDGDKTTRLEPPVFSATALLNTARKDVSVRASHSGGSTSTGGAGEDGGKTPVGSQFFPPSPIMTPRSFWKKSIKWCDLQESFSPPAEVASLPQSLGEFPFWQGNTELLSAVRFVYELAPHHSTQILAHSRRGEPADTK